MGRGSKRWLVEGLRSGLSAVLLSILVMILMAALSWSGFGPIKAFETWSRDFTFRAAIALRGADLQPVRNGGNRIDAIVFLDIDVEACELLIADDWKCRAQGVIHQEVMTFLGAGLRGSGARAIVLDTRLPDETWDSDPAAPLAFADAWRDHGATPIIAAMPGAPMENGFSAADQRIPALNGIMRFAPPVIYGDVEMGDGVIRKLAVETPVRFLSEGTTKTATTLPFATLEAVDTNYRRSNGDAIFYTLPSIVTGLDYQGDLWERRRLSDLIVADADGGLRLRTAGLAGQIVIIGSSAPSADDLHQTPLGTLAGAEILANIVRDVQMFPAHPEISVLEQLVWKVRSLSLAFILVIAGALLNAAINRRARNEGWPAAMRIVLLGAIWAVVVALSFYATVTEALDGLIRTGSYALGGDLLLPLFALVIEEFVVRASAAIHFFDRKAAKPVSLFILRFPRRVAKWISESIGAIGRRPGGG